RSALDPELDGRPRLLDPRLVLERPDERLRPGPEVRGQWHVHHEDDALPASDRPRWPAVELVEAALLLPDPLVEERTPQEAERPAGFVPQADSVDEGRAPPGVRVAEDRSAKRKSCRAQSPLREHRLERRKTERDAVCTRGEPEADRVPRRRERDECVAVRRTCPEDPARVGLE